MGEAFAPAVFFIYSICHGIFLALVPAPENWRHMKGPEESCRVAWGGRRAVRWLPGEYTDTLNTKEVEGEEYLLARRGNFWHE